MCKISVSFWGGGLVPFFNPLKAQCLLYVPPGLTLSNSAFCPHSVFMCFVWIWRQIISLYSINWLFYNRDGECLLRGRGWLFKCNSASIWSSDSHRGTRTAFLPSKSFLPPSVSFHQFSVIFVVLWRLQQHRQIRQTRPFSIGYRKHWTEKHIHIVLLFLRHVRKIVKATLSLFMSVRPHGTTGLPMDGFSWNLKFEYFSKICWENSSFIKKWQE